MLSTVNVELAEPAERWNGWKPAGMHVLRLLRVLR
jgi:hypothetical protein